MFFLKNKMEKWIDHQLLKLQPFEKFECMIEKAKDPFQFYINHYPLILFVYLKDNQTQKTENVYIEFHDNQHPIVLFQNHYMHPLIHDRRLMIQQQYLNLKLLIEYIYDIWKQSMEQSISILFRENSIHQI